MPIETTVIVIAVIAVFAVFAVVLAWVSSIASGADTANNGVTEAHVSATAVRRADVAPALVGKNDASLARQTHA